MKMNIPLLLAFLLNFGYGLAIQAATSSATTSATAAAAPSPSAANTAKRSVADLDALTAPIALYPDALVFQILMASKNFATLESFADWQQKNASLKGDELQNAAQKAGFNEALVALAPFPQVVTMMVEKPDWTKALGQVVAAD